MNTEQPTEEFLRGIDIHELLPQQEPFVMISSLVRFDMQTTVTETIVSADNMFVEDGVFTAPGIVENIAQTCAARIGYVNKYILKKGIQLGFIGAIRDLKVKDLPKVGDTITTTISVIDSVFGMTLVDAVVLNNGAEVASAQMKIAVKESE
ncbi:MAG: pseudouridylate synthase [Bacteroidaceae bacterium]|nr:pseudouridylate synthase [Bacteroidaceae bacterium]MBQ4461490.1 pseudouridylate synthase [Bacteroidaceae bacterium]MBQ5351248.1 pseudouridylate synthase [Bacteroidaceae bacterium]MBQ5478351.1 pseudouridylate synthase [Bacteroidaceae bacterium]MBQ7482819.1 pseudouridylate synthase [Bacteroidaceae bacterium]